MRLGRIDFVRLVEQAQHLADFEEALADAVRALPADPASIIEFLEIPAADAFNVAPEQAISYFKAKGLKPTFSYADMLDGAHDNAFTAAKMMDVDMLGQVRASLDAAMANGTPFKAWADQITPILQSGGWWGRKEVSDPLTGQTIVAQLGSPWRLETIFRTNMQTAYAAGAWQEIQANKSVAPFLMYDAVDDDRTRPLHASWDRRVMSVDHVWWLTHYPPNGYNCRCGVIQLSDAEVEALGLQVAIDPPKDGSYDWTNPRTGEELVYPKGIDPGFANNPGASYAWAQKQLLKEKLAAQTADMQAAAEKAAKRQAQQAATEGTAAAKAAQAEAAAAQAKAALDRAKKVTDEKVKQWGAQQQLDAIAKGAKGDIGAGAQYKIKALSELKKSADWPELKPSEKLQAVDDMAAALKKKNEDAAKLSLYKKAVLEGKTPQPATVKVFNSLPEADKQAFLAKIEAEKAAAEAKKAAEAAAAAKKAAAAEPSAVAQAPGTQPPDPATMVVIGRKSKGGTPGALYQDTATGQKWLVKFNGSADAVRNEVLSAKLYNLAGVEAPDLHAITIDGKPALASRIVDGIVEVDAKTLAATPSVLDGFAVDAWLANWDVMGQSWDNTVLVGGRAMRIDVGGALRYRAVGGLKGSAFGRVVTEIDSLRDGTNAQARAVFGAMTPADIERSIERVLAVREADIRAMVAMHGPVDEAERVALADLLIARQRDLTKRYPAAAERVRLRAGGQAQQVEAPRVTAQEQQWVEESRVNGYGFATDSDQVEDHMVVVHNFKTAEGADITRGFLKLRPGASQDLQSAILKDLPAADAAGAAPSVELGAARSAILSAVKSINFRADGGRPYDPPAIAKIQHAIKEIDDAVARLQKARLEARDTDKIMAARDYLREWRDVMASRLADAQASVAATKTPQFYSDKLPTELGYKIRAILAMKKDERAIQWRKVSGTYTFDAASFDRSFAKLNGSTGTVHGSNLRYEADLPDGTRLTYFPHDKAVAWAMQGIVKIDTPGRGADRTERVFSAMADAGINAKRASVIDRQYLYLNAFARIALLGKGNALRIFEAIADSGEIGLQKKLGMLNAATGLDIEASDGWRQIDGVRQAFGHGRAYQLRPDLQPQQLEDLGKTHVLFHNPQGLGHDAGTGIFERLKTVIDGGGMFASLTDRVRRGVPLAGSSVSSDLATGGGDYHFTRILSRQSAKGTGVYWRVAALRRMDAITYEGDMFGRTTDGAVETYRRGQTVDSFRQVARGGSNETIFKGGMSIFDDVDRVVLSSAAEVKDAIAWLKGRGYKAWPDGRKLEEVVITKAQHGKP